MSEYVPSTEQVRDGYRFNPEDDYYNPVQAGANAERNGRAFDRWLEQVKAQAWHEGYGHGRDDEEAETRTNQMHVTLNPHGYKRGPSPADTPPEPLRYRTYSFHYDKPWGTRLGGDPA